MIRWYTKPMNDGHNPDQPDAHEKHLQLGADLADDDRTPLSHAERDAVWAGATTVEQFKIDIELLANS